MKRVRLDDELIAQGICADRADALRTCMAGLVSAHGERLTSPGMKIEPGISLHVKGRLPYVGRGGLKLEGGSMPLGSTLSACIASISDARRVGLPIACSNAVPLMS